MNVLFVTWDGPQVSYLDSLFLPIFRALSSDGVRFDVLQFTWADATRTQAQKQSCEAAGVRYRAVPVWRQAGGAGAFATALAGRWHIRRAARDWGTTVLMPRSLLPALATLGAARRLSLPILFDADGLMADERADHAGLSRSSATYRVLRDIEAEAVRRSAATLVRTETAAEILRQRAGNFGVPMFVVGNGRDPAVYHPGTPSDRLAIRRALGIAEDVPLLVYCGSWGDQYCVPKMLELFGRIQAQDSRTRMLVLTGAEATAATDIAKLRPDLAPSILARRLDAEQVPAHLAASDLGLAFRKEQFATSAVFPLKLGEYVLCGVPVAGNSNAGAADEVYSSQSGGRVVDGQGEELDNVASWFITSVMRHRERYREIAHGIGISRFSIERTLNVYRNALSTVVGAGEVLDFNLREGRRVS